jgi:hypothetical protein
MENHNSIRIEAKHSGRSEQQLMSWMHQCSLHSIVIVKAGHSYKPNLDARGDWNMYQNWALPDSRNVTFARFCNPSEPPCAWSSLLCYRVHKLNDHERVVSLILSTALATPHQRESAGPALWVPCATQRCDLHRLPNQTRAFLKHLITNRPVLKRALIPGLYMYSFDTIQDSPVK